MIDSIHLSISFILRLNALSNIANPGHREPCAETNARVGIKFAAQNVIDVSTVNALSYVEVENVELFFDV